MKRVLIKLSGEALKHGSDEIYDMNLRSFAAREISGAEDRAVKWIAQRRTEWVCSHPL